MSADALLTVALVIWSVVLIALGIRQGLNEARSELYWRRHRTRTR